MNILNNSNDETIFLSMQWHITTKCGNNCKHCYVYDKETYESESRNTLSFFELIEILDDIKKFESKYNANVNHVTVSGGDPLLSDCWYQFVKELKHRGKKVGMMGNPETLTENVLEKFVDLGVENFQMSLDGLEEIHDKFRSPGSFQKTIEALRMLDKYNIRSNIMFTLYPDNSKELLPLMRYVATQTEAKSFSFDLGCYVGNGTNLSNKFNEKQIFELFNKFLDEKELLRERGYSCVIGNKSNLLKVANFAKNKYYPLNPKDTPIVSGCSIGWNPMTLLSDGTALACRRLPIKIGKLPQESFEDLFLGNFLLKKFRRRNSFEDCSNCDFYSNCRGCPAYVFSTSNDPFASNPICFRKDIKRDTDNSDNLVDPPLATTYQEEWSFIASRYLPFSQNQIEKYLKNKDFYCIYLNLLFDPKEKKRFITNPIKYIESSQYCLSEAEIVVLLFRFTRKRLDDNGADHHTTLGDPIATVIFRRLFLV